MQRIRPFRLLRSLFHWLLRGVERQLREVGSSVLERTEAAVLRRGAGHVSGTVLPGAAGTLDLAGHRDSLLRPLEEVRRGETGVLDATPDARSEHRTLITCFLFRSVGSAPRRFVVHGRRRAPRSWAPIIHTSCEGTEGR